MKRRTLFKAGMAALATTLANKISFGKELFQDKKSTGLQKRQYAQGVDLSVIGFG